MSQSVVGQPVDRVDGKLKVRGKARYAAEFKRPNLAYAVIVSSTISNGKITEIDVTAAENLPGVLAIVTHKNAPKLITPKADKKAGAMPGDQFAALQSAEIHFDGQPVALVVAETIEQATRAAEQVKVAYTSAIGEYDVAHAKGEPGKPARMFDKPLQKKKGDVDAALKNAAITIEQTYITPIQNHCAMELSATVAEWEGDQLTVYDATQGVMSTRKIVADVLGMPVENVRVVCHFMGGGFGSKGFSWPHTVLAAVAAQIVKRPVQLALKRQQNFTNIGHREKTIQQISLAADKAGKLQAIRHITTTGTSRLTEFVESCGLVSGMLYDSPNTEIAHYLHALDIGSPTPMRAPGECPGSFALECAMDELAYKVNIDPLELRLINYAENDSDKNVPWSSKELKRCYDLAAENFGWKNRKHDPKSTQEGTEWVGWGMATATYPANKSPASAKARMYPDGSVVIQSATQDLGTGTYTIMTQIAADALGMPVNKVRFELGDSKFPKAPVSGGSQSAASVGPMVLQVATQLREKVTRMAIESVASPLHGKKEEELAFGGERIHVKDNTAVGENYNEIVQRSGSQSIDVVAEENKPDEEEKKKHSFHSFGAHFVEVKVDPILGRARVTRIVSAFDMGKILNQKTARSQAIGGIVFGIGMALMEGTERDPSTGRVVTKNLADYLVPVNADIPDIEILFTDVPDLKFNSIGARGVGEIGLTGISAAIANAIFHATGKRIRELPITTDKLIV